jgi:RNA-dependent RNA polymerase
VVFISAGLIELRKVQLRLGTLTSLHDLLLSWRAPECGCSLRVNKEMRKISLFFSHEKVMSANLQDRELCEFKLEMSVRDVRQVKEVQTQRGRMPELMMVLQLWSPPLISYRTAQGDDVYCATHAPLPDDDDPWIRTVDFTPQRSIGRCLAYVISVPPTQGTPFRQLLEFFRLQRVCDRSPPRRLNLSWEEEMSLTVRQNYFFVPDRKNVPFELMFLVNALVHRGIVNITSLTDEFYRAIMTDYALSVYALQHMNTYSHPVFNAVMRIQQVKEWARKYEKVREKVKVLPSGCMMVHRVMITPTRAYCAVPVREMSNRVLRHFHTLSDRFLRVSFLDDDLHQVPAFSLTVPVAPIVRSLSTAPEFNRTEIYRRVLNIVKTGFTLCGRQYQFLAFSSSQLRDASAWFFAANKYVNAHQIRRWMGQFPTQNIAKFAARMGQCFSSTFLTLAVPKEKVMRLADVQRNGYIFSDGCGRIAPEFALQVSETLKLDHTPSLYQIRYAGCKGVVATWPIESPPGRQHDLGVRDSMNKFVSDHTELEVIGWSKYLPCYLNRQIICLLSTLQVENSAFRSLQDAQVARLEAMLEDPGVAYEVLTRCCSGDVHSTAATMLQGGFHPKNEPHLYDMLLSIRTSQLEDLVSKARIYVPDGRWLMGCMDETGLLSYGQCFIQVSGPVKKGSLGGDGFNQQHRSGPLQVRRLIFYYIKALEDQELSTCAWCSSISCCHAYQSRLEGRGG